MNNEKIPTNEGDDDSSRPHERENNSKTVDKMSTEKSKIQIEKNSKERKEERKEVIAPPSEIETRRISVAQFFDQNKSIAGFGNPMRATFTSIRELVENGLDAAEKLGVPPRIDVNIEKLLPKEIQKLFNLKTPPKGEKNLDFLRISVKDNGVGVPGSSIPWLFGRVLTGTKYGAQQTRGTFGLGAKMCLLYAMSTVDVPVTVKSRHKDSKETHEYQLFIDLEKNEPIIHSHKVYQEGEEGAFETSGTEVSVTITGAWSRARSYVLEYFKQLAIITPYADFFISIPGDKIGVKEELKYLRVIDDMPPPPKTVPIHPWGCDITQFKTEIKAAKEDNLIDFLVNHFMGVSRQAAESFFEVLGIDASKNPHELTQEEIRRIVHEGFKKSYEEAKTVKRKRDRIFKFDEPSGDALSPLGAHRLRKGLEKELHPAFVEAVTRPPKAYSGHPFIIEAALGYGGGVSASSTRMTTHDNKIVYRFANRIPLIFGAGSDVVTSVVGEIKWNEYGLTKSSDPLAIAVSLVSTKIPFPETSKEYIDHVDEIAEEIRLALMQLGRKLRTYLRRTRTRQRERQRVSRFERYAPQTISNLVEILKRDGRWEEYLEHEKARITAALASGETRVIRMEYLPGVSLPEADVWLSRKDEKILLQHGINTVSDFLITPNKKLSKLLNKTEERIDLIKRRTIYELDLDGRSPPLIEERILKEEIDKKFVGAETKEGNKFLSLKETFLRRWIKTGYDYLVSPIDQLARILYLEEKLFEQKKEELKQLANSIQQNIIPDETIVAELEAALEKQETINNGQNEVVENVKELKPNEIDLDLLIPSFEEIKELANKLFSKRGINTHYDFLVQIRSPNRPLGANDLGQYLIDHLINYFSQRVKLDSQFLKQPITKLVPDWTDGYTKTAFKRRKITTVEDFLKTEKDILYEIGELKRNLFEKFVNRILTDYKTPLDHIPTELPELLEKYDPLKTLKQAKITTVEAFLNQSSPKIKNNKKLSSFFSFLLEESKLKLLKYYKENSLTNPITAVKDFPREYERYLLAKGIRKKMDFILAPLKELVKKDFDRERVLEIKERLGSSIKKWFPQYYDVLKNQGIVTLEQLVYTPKNQLDRLKDPEARKIVRFIAPILELPVTLISRQLIPHADVLYEAGIVSVGKFLTWNLEDISMLTNMSLESIKELIEKTDIQQLQERAEQIKGTIKILSKLGFEDVTIFVKKYDITSLEEFYFLDLFASRLYKGKKFQLIEKISNVYIEPVEDFLNTIFPGNKPGKKKLLTLLKKDKLLFTYQLFRLTPQQINKYGSEKKNLLNEALGTLLYAENPELKDKKEAYQLFKAHYLLHKSISELVDLSPNALRRLKNLSYTRVGQFFMHSPEEISELINEPITKIRKVFSSPRVGREPVPLFIEEGKTVIPTIKFKFEDEEHFSSKELIAFKEHGYYYIDEVYFKTHPYTFEVVGVSWDTVKRFNKLLGSPLVLMSWEQKQTVEVIPDNEETIDSEEENSSTNPDQQTKMPEKEEQSPLTKEITYYESLTAKQMDFLAKKGIVNVIDFLLAENKTLGEYLGWDEDKVKARKRSIILEETGIELSELDLLRPRQLKALEEKGIVTLEDLYFSTYEETWDEPELPWESLSIIKKLLRLPIRAIKEDIDEEVLKALQDINIPNILSFILTANEVLEFKTGMPAERFENTKAGINFAELQDTYDKPVYFTPGLSYNETQMLYENGYQRIVDLLLENPNKIAKILDKKTSEIKNILLQIDKTSIQKTEDERGIAIKEIGVFSPQEERTIIHSSVFEYNKIDTLQELYYQINEGTFYGPHALLEKIKWVRKALDIPVEFLIKSNEILSILKQRNILLLRDLLFYYTMDEEYSATAIEIINSLYRELIDLSRVVALAMIPLKSLLLEETNFAEQEEESILEYLSKNSLNGKLLPGNITLLDLVRFFSSPIRITPLSRHIQPGEEHLLDAKVAELLLEKFEETESVYLINQYLKIRGGLRQVLKRLKLPISVLPIKYSTMFRLISRGIATVQEFMSYDVKMLSNYSGLTQKELKNIISKFTYDNGLEKLRTTGIPVEFTTYFDDETINGLKANGIEYFDQIICYSQLELAELPKNLQEKITKVKEALLGSIQFLPQLSAIEKHSLRNQGITSPYGVLVSYQIKGKSINEMIEKVDLNRILTFRKELGVPLSWLGIEDQELILQLNQFQVYNAQDFYDHFISEKYPLEMIPSKLRTFIRHGQFLNSPIGLIDIPIEEKIEFFRKESMLLIDILPELVKTKPTKTLTYYEERAKELSLPLASLTPLNKGLISRLEKMEVPSAQQILPMAYVPTFQSQLSASLKKDLAALVNHSIYSISIFDEQIISKLSEHNISKIGELLLLSSEQLKEIIGNKTYEKFVNGQYTYRKSTELPIEVQNKLGITSIQELITEYISVKYSGAHQEVLSFPLALSKLIPNQLKAVLRRKGIKSLGEFISQDTKQLAAELKISRKTLEEYKVNILKLEEDTELVLFFKPLTAENIRNVLSLDAKDELNILSVIEKEQDLTQILFTILPALNMPFEKWDDYEEIYQKGIVTLLDGLLMSYWGELSKENLNNLLETWDAIVNQNIEPVEPLFEREDIIKLVQNLSQNKKPIDEYLIPLEFVVIDNEELNYLYSKDIYSLWQVAILPYNEQNRLKSLDFENFKSIKKRYEQIPFKLTDIEFSNKTKAMFEKYGITTYVSIPEKLINQLSPADQSKLLELTKTMHTSLVFLSEINEKFQTKIKELWNINIKTIDQLFLEFVRKGEEKTKELVKSVTSLEKILEVKKNGIQITNQLFLSAGQKRALEKQGISTIEDYISIPQSKFKQLNEEIKNQLNEFLSMPPYSIPEYWASYEAIPSNLDNVKDLIISSWLDLEKEKRKQLLSILNGKYSIEPDTPIEQLVNVIPKDHYNESIANNNVKSLNHLSALLSSKTLTINDAPKLLPYLITPLDKIVGLDKTITNKALQNNVRSRFDVLISSSQELSEKLGQSLVKTREWRKAVLINSRVGYLYNVNEITLIQSFVSELKTYGIDFVDDVINPDLLNNEVIVSSNELKQLLTALNEKLSLPVWELDYDFTIMDRLEDILVSLKPIVIDQLLQEIKQGEKNNSFSKALLKPALTIEIENEDLKEIYNDIIHDYFYQESTLTLLDLVAAYPLSFIINPQDALKLETINIDKIVHLLLPHSKRIIEKHNISISFSTEQILEKLLTFDFKTIIENEGIDINKLSLLSAPQKKQLREVGCVTVQQFLVLSNNLLSKIKGVTPKIVENVDSVLALPLYAFGSLIELDPTKAIQAYKKGCKTIKQLYYLKVSDTEKMYGISKQLLEDAIEKLSTKIAKKYLDNAVPKLNAFSEIRKKDLDKLSELGISDIRDLVLLSKEDIDKIKDQELKNRLFKVIQRINVPLTDIPEIGETIASKLPINTWGELMFLSEKQISTLTGLSYPAVRKIRTNIPSLAPKKKHVKTESKRKSSKSDSKKQTTSKKKPAPSSTEKTVSKSKKLSKNQSTEKSSKTMPSSKTSNKSKSRKKSSSSKKGGKK